jgi:dihydroorotate dehydrogenase
LTKLPPKLAVRIYSHGRKHFLSRLDDELPEEAYIPPEASGRELWGIKFRSPIMNAAGMFKNGECYDMTAMQGAGAYMGGTGTWNPRKGNEKDGISLPFATYPKSSAASNWLGLPNDGDKINFRRADKIERVDGYPVGWSVMGSPDLHGEEKLQRLVQGMELYEGAGVEFLELNESCPNTYPVIEDARHELIGIKLRLRDIKERFLDQRERNLPVIVKFSNDTSPNHLPEILDILLELDFDGVNFGNTSIQYRRRGEMIDPEERKLYDYFTKIFGGGVSGYPLRESSLELASGAVQYVKGGPPAREFHVIRTGGIETLGDIEDSERAGISLNQWFTGYFEGFARHGHDVYRQLYENRM